MMMFAALWSLLTFMIMTIISFQCLKRLKKVSLCFLEIFQLDSLHFQPPGAAPPVAPAQGGDVPAPSVAGNTVAASAAAPTRQSKSQGTGVNASGERVPAVPAAPAAAAPTRQSKSQGAGTTAAPAEADAGDGNYEDITVG